MIGNINTESGGLACINNCSPPVVEIENTFVSERVSVDSELLVVRSIEDFRKLSDEDIFSLVSGGYKGVQVLGYYREGDTPSPINYYLSEDTSSVDDGGSVFVIKGKRFKHDFIGDIDIRYFGAKYGIEDNKWYIQNALDYCFKNKVKTLVIDNRYKVSNLHVYDSVNIIGSGELQALDINYLVTTSVIVANVMEFTPKDSIDNYLVDDVLIFKSDTEDIVVVTGTDGGKVQIKPFIMFHETTDTNVGFKYGHPIGTTYYKHNQIIWVTKSMVEDLTMSNSVTDVNINLTLKGSKEVNANVNSIYQLTSTLVNFFGTESCNINSSKLYHNWTTAVLYYGYNKDFKFIGNIVSDIGYGMPLSYEPQRADSTSGIALHWSQRFQLGDPRLKENVSSNYEISSNSFTHCWNGGIFLSATNTGRVFANTIKDYVSHGICYYGGDYGIDAYDVEIFSNTVKGANVTGQHSDALGCAIWCSVVRASGTIHSNIVDDAEIGLYVGFSSNIKLYNNKVSNCRKIYIQVDGSVYNTSFYFNNVKVSDNSDTNAQIVKVDSSSSSMDIENLLFKDNEYLVSSGWVGKPIYDLYKIGTTFINDDKCLGSIEFMINNGIQKVTLVDIDFRNLSGSGATVDNSNRIKCIENNGVVITSSSNIGDEYFQGSKIITSGDVATQSSIGLVKKGVAVPNGSSIDDLLASLRTAGIIST